MIFVNPYSRVNVDIPNVSLAYSAAIHEADVVDFNTDPRPLDSLLERETELLGISMRSLCVAEAGRIAAAYAARHPDTRIVSVGTQIDIMCCYPFRRWDDHLEFEAPFSDAYPLPAYDRFDTFERFRDNWRLDRWRYPMMTSLGCPFPCAHCMCRNRKWLTRSVDSCMEELQRAKERWGICSFLVLDDCFNVSHRRVIEFCERVAPLGLRWECANGLRADLFNEEQARALAAAGCSQVSFGIESIDDEILVTMKKRETFAQLEQAVKVATRHIRDVNGFFIIGLPGSTYEKDRQGLTWAEQMGITAHFSYFVPPEVGLPDDQVFYGDGARPLSDAYPADDQTRVYLETSGYRPVVPPNRVTP